MNHIGLCCNDYHDDDANACVHPDSKISIKTLRKFGLLVLKDEVEQFRVEISFHVTDIGVFRVQLAPCFVIVHGDEPLMG